MTSDDRLEALMRELRAQYLADADERVAELRSGLARVDAREPESLDRLRRLFHKLAGSGGSYGLDDVTAHSREGERATKRLLDAGAPPDDAALAELTPHVQRVADAFAAAKKAGLDGSIG
jgi:HPt (histidine-containing phosphotransfer) domain-containing protein